MAVFDGKAIDHPIKSLIWKRCRDNVIALWAHTHEYANHYAHSFTCVDPKTCYPSRTINKIPEGIVFRLRRIRDSSEKYEKRLKE